MRAAFYRRLKLAMLSNDVRKVIGLAMDERNERGIRTPLDLLREVKAIDSEEAQRFVEVMRSFRPRIIVNDVRSAEDIRLGFSVRSVCRKYFAIDAEYLGYVNHDAAARASVRARRPLVDSDPRSDAAVYLARIARKLIAPRIDTAGESASFAQRAEGERRPSGGGPA
jgi:flagellar biosynthesis protein FlhG